MSGQIKILLELSNKITSILGVKFAYIVTTIVFVVAYTLFAIDNTDADPISDISFPANEKLFDGAFKTDTGEIFGFKSERIGDKFENKLYFFRIKSKDECFTYLVNTSIDIDTCQITVPSAEPPKELSYRHNHCIDISPENMFESFPFFYQFKNRPNDKDIYGKFQLFTTSSPEVAHCFRK